MSSRALAALLLAAAAAASAQDMPKVKDTEGLFLDMSKVNLGTISSEDDKKKYIYTIQLEKSRLTRQSLKIVYENAFDLYKEGQFEGANELTQKILAIDPGYEDARILNRATLDLKGSPQPSASRHRLVADRFEEGMTMYRQGRLVEASDRWDEVVKLSPLNLKARYWLRRAHMQMADEHFRRGQKAYQQHRLRETLDQWYSALVLNPHYPRLTSAIAKVESEERDQEANEKLRTALNLYGQGLVLEALKVLDQVLEVGPGNTKAQKLQAEIRSEIANQHVAEGRRLYESRQYKQAIEEWKTAVEYGYDENASKQLTQRAKQQMQLEEAAREKAKAAQLAKAEEDKKKEEEEKAAAEQQKKEKDEADAKAKAAADQAAQTGQPAAPAAGAGASDTAKQQSQQRYLEGIVFFQQGNYEKAREKAQEAKDLDPSNPDAAGLLDRINKLYGGGQ